MISHKIQITIDPEFDLLLKKMKLRFPLMKEVDLLRMSASGFYSQNRELFEIDTEYLSEADSQIIEQAKSELTASKNKKTTFSSGKDLINFAKTKAKAAAIINK